jgi:hypothetical protein
MWSQSAAPFVHEMSGTTAPLFTGPSRDKSLQG